MKSIYSYNTACVHPRSKVLRAVRAGIKTAAEISRASGISVSVCNKYARELAEHKLVKIKTDGKKRAFAPVKARSVMLGIHILDDAARLSLVTPEGEEKSSPFLVDGDTVGFSEAVLSAAEELINDSPVKVCAIGISVRGPANTAEGLLVPTERVGDIDVFSFADEMKEAFSLPVFVGTDAECGGKYYMNKSLSAEQGLLVFVSAGKSIDAAIFDSGRLIRGACGLAGLLGHVSISRNERCYCGNRGCLENTASLSRLYDGGDMTLFGMKQARTLDDVKEEYKNGETGTVRELENMATELATALVSVIDLLNPSHLVIGGDIAKIGDLMSSPLHSVIKQRVMMESFNSMSFDTVREGDEAIIGAALGAFELILDAKRVEIL